MHTSIGACIFRMHTGTQKIMYVAWMCDNFLHSYCERLEKYAELKNLHACTAILNEVTIGYWNVHLDQMALLAKIQLFNLNHSRVNHFLSFFSFSFVAMHFYPAHHAKQIKTKWYFSSFDVFMLEYVHGWWNWARSSALWNDSSQNYYDSLELVRALSTKN